MSLGSVIWQQVGKKEEYLLSKTDAHSWFGKRTHIVRENGTLVRATVGPLVVFSSHWGFKCTYYNSDNRSKRTKVVSPVNLMFTQYLWEKCEVLSDAEENARATIAFGAEVSRDIATQRDTDLVNSQLRLHADRGFQLPERSALALEWGLAEVLSLQRVLCNGSIPLL